MNQMGQQGTPFVFMFDFSGKKIKFWPQDQLSHHKVYFNFGGKGNFQDFLSSAAEKEFYLIPHPVSFTTYQKAFDYVVAQEKKGNSYLVNLTFPTRLDTNLDLHRIFYSSQSRYKLLYQDQFVFFSPETFVQIRGNSISTYPMKGTIDATIPAAKQQILQDQKEMAEHVTIVDLLRNDLSQIASQVRVEKFRYIDRIDTYDKALLQVSSQITGTLPDNWKNQIGSILARLLPAGSVTGAPKAATLNIIKAAENYSRGFFTGIAGYFDGENLDSCVMIRFIENINGVLYFKSGGGITIYSDARQEYQELIDKVYVPFVRNHQYC